MDASSLSVTKDTGLNIAQTSQYMVNMVCHCQSALRNIGVLECPVLKFHWSQYTRITGRPVHGE